MKYIKGYKLFESTEIDFSEVEEYLIDFKHAGFKCKISYVTSLIIDWDKANKEGKNLITSGQMDDYSAGIQNKTLLIDLTSSDIISMEISDLENAFYMVYDYLRNEFNLSLNYIYINRHWDYLYYKDIDSVLNNIQSKNRIRTGQSQSSHKLEAHRISFGFK